MSDSVFIDASVLLYLYTTDEPEKKRRAEATIVRNGSWISAQSLSELVTLLRKNYRLDYLDIQNVLSELTRAFHVATISADTIQSAIKIAKIYQYKFYDSLVIASALEADCGVLYSQNLHSGQRIEKKLKIHNPFVGVARTANG